MQSTTIFSVLIVAALAIAAPSRSVAASAAEIDESVNEAIAAFEQEVDGGAEFLSKAAGYLVFPRVIKIGVGVGGEGGEGALRVNGQTVDYYSTFSGSIGFQLGAQAKSIVIAFMTNEALSEFRNSKGWKVGVDGSVAIIDIGAGKAIDSTNIKDPVVGFIFNSKGLMYNLTLEGSKITKLDKS
ncbi:MAG: YSC84-related protein [Woeseiaceae bacterium]|nr:YSC84-related protein [Woeseiaceae bacterium]